MPLSSAKPEAKATVRITRRLPAPAERVFDAWLDARTLGKWLFATPTGTMVTVETDARTGGAFRIVERRDGVDVEHTGEYREIVRPARLVFTFAVPKYSKETTRVIIGIVPHTEGCELTLTHEGVLPDYEERTRQGWGMILERLAATLR